VSKLEEPHTSPLTERGLSVCRGCRASKLESILDLGEQPLANEMPMHVQRNEPVFTLHLRGCTNCGLGQVGEYVLPERIFGNEYPYLSSTSSTWVEHARRYAEAMHDHLGLTEPDLVVEIASNDGYLLREMHNLGPRVLGVEPAGNIASIAVSAGIPTWCRFFGREVASDLVAEHGIPRLVVANNVMAHVPDLDDFVAGLAVLCGESTLVTIENPSFQNLLQDAQFDTIYHEHFSYLSAHSIEHIAGRHGLELVRVERLPTHGGSNRYWLRRTGVEAVDASVRITVAEEISAGLLDPATWEQFRDRSQIAIANFRYWLDSMAKEDARIVGYGAAAKGNTLFNAALTTTADIVAVVDGAVAKQGRHLPGSQLPVLAPDAMPALAPTDVLVIPWNLVEEIAPLVQSLAPRARIWTALPQMSRVA